MKIVRLELLPVSIPYRATYVVALGKIQNCESLIVKLHTDEGVVGVGEGHSILVDRGGESVESMMVAISKYLGPRLIGEDPFDIERIMHKLEEGFYGRYVFPYSKSAIDGALYDLVGKALDVPAYKLLGGAYRRRYSVGRSLPLEAPEKMADRALELKEAGYKAVTVKGGFGDVADVEALAAVRKAVGDDFPVDVDANQAYSASTCMPLLKRLEQFNPTAFEQPLPWWDLDGMAEVARVIDTPIIAHESLMTIVDCLNIIKKRAADVLCLQLVRNMGFYWTKKLVALAEAAGMPCTLGSSHPLGIGAAAMAHLVASTSAICEPIGYGSPLERLTDDVLAEPLDFHDGVVTVPPGPGLGVNLDEEKMKKYSIQGRTVPHVVEA